MGSQELLDNHVVKVTKQSSALEHVGLRVKGRDVLLGDLFLDD